MGNQTAQEDNRGSGDQFMQEQMLRERIKELNCLYRVTSLFNEIHASPESVIPPFIDYIIAAYQYPEITAVRVSLDGQFYTSAGFIQTQWCQSSPIIVSGEKTGIVEVYYLKDMPAESEGPFLTEERKLIDSLSSMLGQFIDRINYFRDVNLLASIVHSSADAIYTTKLDGTITSWNEGAAKLYLTASKEVLGKNISGFIPDERKEDLNYIISEVYKEKSIDGFVTERIRRNGERFPVSLSISPLKSPAGAIAGKLVISKDISDKIVAEEKLKKSEEKFRLLAENSTDVIWTMDLNGKYLYVSPSVERLRGYTQEEVMKQSIHDALSPASEALMLKTLRDLKPAILAGQKVEPRTFILEQPCKNGGVVWSEATISGIYNEKGFMISFLGVTRDITHRKVIEDQLKLKEAAIQSSISAIVICDLEGTILYVNRAFVRMWGYDSTDEIIGRNFTEFSTSGERANFIKKEIAAGKSITNESGGIRKDGSTFEILYVIAPVFNEKMDITHMMGSFVDITETKKTDRQLTATEGKLELMIQGGNIGLWDWNIRTGENIVSERWLGMLGYSANELPHKIEVWEELSHPEDLVRATDLLHKHIQGEIPHYSAEMRMKHKNGNWIWVFTQGKVMEWDNEGKPLRVTGTHLDITERKKAETQARMNSERIAAQYRISLMEDKSEKEIIEYALEEAVKFTDSDAGFIHILEQDQETVRLNAWSKAALRDCSRTEKVHYPLAEAGIWADCCKTGKPFICNDYQNETSAKGYPEGHYIVKRFLCTPVSESGRIKIICGVGNKLDDYDEIDVLQFHEFIEEVWKIIKKCRLNEELRTAKEKAEESSQLKSSLLLNMSHELRTPLNGIMGFSNLLRDELSDPSLKGMANLILLSGKRLMVTLTSILELSQLESVKSQPLLTTVDISEIAETIVNRFKDQAEHKNLHLVRTIQAGVCLASDSVMISNIMYYLIDNAIKFTETGSVWISLQRRIRNGGRVVLIRVKDTGIGIREEQMKYIFEPFRQGSEGIGRSHEGSGLGLTLCRKFVTLLGGTIEMESIPGAGSTFTVCFTDSEERPPVATDQIVPVSEHQGSARIQGTSGTVKKILIVEDNLANAELVAQYLRIGFETDIAISGKLAVKYAWQNDYDLILMDINLGPGMDGIAASKEIRLMKNYASLPIIAITGYSTSSERKYILEQGLNDFLSKPFSKEDLLNAVNKALKSMNQGV